MTDGIEVVKVASVLGYGLIPMVGLAYITIVIPTMWVNCCVRLLRAAVAMLACCNVGLCCMCVWWLLAGSCMSFGLCNSNLLQELVWLLIGCSHALLVYPHRGVLFRAGAQGALLSKSQIEKTGTLSYVDRLRSRRWHVYFHRWSTRSGWLRTLFFCVTHRSPY